MFVGGELLNLDGKQYIEQMRDFYKVIEEQIKENPQEEEIKVGFEEATQEQGEIENESPTQTMEYI